MADQQSNIEVNGTANTHKEENLNTKDNTSKYVLESDAKESIPEIENQNLTPEVENQSLPPPPQNDNYAATQAVQDLMTERGSTSAVESEGQSHSSLGNVPAPDDEGTAGNEVTPASAHELQRSTSTTAQIKHMSLHKEILSPLAKGVQSVPIFAMSSTQAKKFADAGFIKPHTSKAELSLSSSTNVKASGAAAIKEKLQSLADDIKKVTSKKIEPVPETPATPASQEESESSSCNGSEGDTIIAVQMESLSLSALDRQKNDGDEGKGDMSNTATNVLGTSSTLSDSTLLVIEKKSHHQGKSRSKSHSFLKLSTSSLKVLSLNCIGKGVDSNQASSDEATSYKSGYKSSLDETANGRSDKENGSKKKKKQKKKRKWIKKSTSDTTKESEVREHPPTKMKPAHHMPFTPFSKICKDQLGTETPSNFLEWDHFGENMMKGNTSVGSFGEEETMKSAGKYQYHKDIISIFRQIEKEGGPKLTQMITVDMADEEKLSLAMTILHLHQKKEDIQKMMEVTQEHLWETQSEVENLHSQLSELENCNQVVKMENMKMEEKLNRSGSQLLQIRTELETKITNLEREIQRLEKSLQEQRRTTSDALKGPVEQKDLLNQNGRHAEMKALKFQNSQLREKLCRSSEQLNKQHILTKTFTQFTEYLKFRLLLLEETMMKEKQHMHKLMERVSSANAEFVTCDNGKSTAISLCDISVEFESVPEHDNPVSEVKGHIALVQQVLGAFVTERGNLENAIKITLEESRLERTNLKAELESLQSAQEAASEEEIRKLQERCLQLSEDNDRLEDICVQNAKELQAEKEKYQQMTKDGEADQMSYSQLIVNHLQLEDDLKQRLLVAEKECTQAKKAVTEKIQQVSSLQKKCSELISIESQLRMTLEHMREDSQHKINKLEENRTLAISSLNKQRTKQDADKLEHEAEIAELKTALQKVCDSLKETTQQNLELMRQCQNLEKEKIEREEYIKDLNYAASESQHQLEDTQRQLNESHKEVKELHGQCSAQEVEKKHEQMRMKQERDSLTTQHRETQSQLGHYKRLVEELQQMVKKQEVQHDDVLEELLQRNVEHDKAVEQIQESTKCIQEMQDQYQHMHGEKETLRGMLEANLHRLLRENQDLKTELRDSQQLVKEQHTKCHKLSEDLKSATEELKKRDHTIANLRQELAVSVAAQKKEFDTRLEENSIARSSLEGRLCRSECSEKELRESEQSLQVKLAVQMQTVKLLEDEKRKNAGLEQQLQAMENQLRENNKSLEISSSSSVYQANEIKMLRDAVNATKNQLKELIENKMHTALLNQLQEKQDLTNKLTEALSLMETYEQYMKQDAEVKESLTVKSQHLQEECNSLTSLLQEEKQKNVNISLQMKELRGHLATENQEKLILLHEKGRMIDWNQNILQKADSLSSSLGSISAGQTSELGHIKESSGKLASDIQLILRLPSGGLNDKDHPSNIINRWSNPFGFFNFNNTATSQQTRDNKQDA